VSFQHWVYVIGVFVILAVMIYRRHVILPAMLFTFIMGLLYHQSLIKGLQTVFNSIITGTKELLVIIIIIALMVAMLKSLKESGADEIMVAPLKKLMVGPNMSFITLILAQYVLATFFWPTPTVPIIGCLLVPVAVRAGLPPLFAAAAMGLGGQGMALAGDILIQGALKITASAAHVPIEMVLWRGGVLSLIVGVVAITLFYLMNRREIDNFKNQMGSNDEVAAAIENAMGSRAEEALKTGKKSIAKFLAVFTPTVLLVIIVAMVYKKILGGNASALIGGTAALLMLISAVLTFGLEGFNKAAEYTREGLMFSFKIMGPIIPIAGYFYLGNPEQSAQILGKGAPGYLFDVGNMLAAHIPNVGIIAGLGILAIGMLGALDAAGFSVLPLTGALAGAFAGGSQEWAATLGAIGQMGAIWTGGGALVPWCSLVAVAGICGVDVTELARRNFIPVVVGLVIATIAGVLFMR